MSQNLIKSIFSSKSGAIPYQSHYSGLYSPLKGWKGRLVQIQKLKLLNEILKSAALRNIDSEIKKKYSAFWQQIIYEYFVSPIGLLDLYEDYYFDLGSTLGPAEEHLTIFPFSTTELIEIISQTTYKFAESETTIEIIQREEETTLEKEELATEIQRQSEMDINAGISAEGGCNFEVWHVGGSSNLDFGNHNARANTEMRKKTREISRKVAREMNQKVRRLTRESYERKQETTRKHSITNNTNQIFSYEMCRKYNLIGIQQKHLGTQLCYQIYIDLPGKDLGLAELIHIAKPEDFNTTPPPIEAPPDFKDEVTQYVLHIPFSPINQDINYNNIDYINGENQNFDKHIDYTFIFHASAPKVDYELVNVKDINYQGMDPDEDQPSLWVPGYRLINDGKDGSFEYILKQVNFHNQVDIQVTLELSWKVNDDVKEKADKEYKTRMEEYHIQQQREAREAMIEGLRERINMIRSVMTRPSQDLRQEERTILYRRVIQKLINDKNPNFIHDISEQISSYFEIDKLLYFIAPDWWKPRFNKTLSSTPLEKSQLNGLQALLSKSGKINPKDKKLVNSTDATTSYLKDKTNYLSDDYRVAWGGSEAKRDNNYFITEDSNPAPLGSSVGWLMQIDGDDHRNAFLNAAWAKIVLPIRRGMEKETIGWLQGEFIEGSEALDTEITISEQKQKIRDLINILIDTLISDDNKIYQEKQKVYEYGLNPLGQTTTISNSPFDIVAEWIEVVPTKQVVARPYTPVTPGLYHF